MIFKCNNRSCNQSSVNTSKFHPGYFTSEETFILNRKKINERKSYHYYHHPCCICNYTTKFRILQNSTSPVVTNYLDLMQRIRGKGIALLPIRCDLTLN